MKNIKQTKKAVMYARVASQATDKTQESIVTQERACKDWAKENGYEIVGKYQDVGASGLKLINRKALVDAIARCQSKTNPIDVLLVTDMDRLSRDTVDLLFIKSQIDLNGTKVIAVNQSLISESPEGQFMEEIIAGVNAFYSKLSKKERRYCEYCGNLL